MKQSRRQFLTTSVSTVSTIALAGCVAPHDSPPPFKGYKSSYTNQILKPENRNAVFHWLDLALQQTRDQRVLAPRAAYNFGLVTAISFLAANSIEQAYDEPYGIGSGPDGANSEVAYGVAFALAAGEAFQTPYYDGARGFSESLSG